MEGGYDSKHDHEVDNFLITTFNNSDDSRPLVKLCADNHLITVKDLRTFLHGLEGHMLRMYLGHLKPLPRENLLEELFGPDYKYILRYEGNDANTENRNRMLKRTRNRGARIANDSASSKTILSSWMRYNYVPQYKLSILDASHIHTQDLQDAGYKNLKVVVDKTEEYLVFSGPKDEIDKFHHDLSTEKHEKDFFPGIEPNNAEQFKIDPSHLVSEDVLGLGKFTKDAELIYQIHEKLREVAITTFSDMIELVEHAEKSDCSNKLKDFSRLDKKEQDLLLTIYEQHKKETKMVDVEEETADMFTFPNDNNNRNIIISPMHIPPLEQIEQKDVVMDHCFKYPRRDTHSLYKHDKYLETYHGNGVTILGHIEKAIRRSDGKPVVLKFCDIEKSKRKMELAHNENLEKEISIQEYVMNHCYKECPHFVRLLDVHINGSSVVCVQEYANGEGLFDYVQHTMKKFSAEKRERYAKRFFRQMANVLRVLHSHGIVHCDVSLENFVLDWSRSEPEVKIIDFGLALDGMEDNFRRTGVVGKREYCAPELYERTFDTRANDIHCLGVCLFIMLAGFPPFKYANDDHAKLIQGGYLKEYWSQCLPKFLSDDALDLAQQMLYPEDYRFTMCEIFEHPWMRDKEYN